MPAPPRSFFALVEHPFVGRKAPNFWVGKCLGLFAVPVVVVAFFYTYAALLGRSFLPAHISTFVLAAAVGQWLSYRIITSDETQLPARRWAMAGLAIMILGFTLLSHYPPRFTLSEDARTGEYGILNHRE